MFYTACTLGQLRKAVDGLIEAVGEDVPVGVIEDGEIGDDIMLKWVCINQETGKIVGTEADDYESKLKPGEINAIGIK